MAEALLMLPSALSLLCSHCPQFPHWLWLYQPLSLTTRHERGTSAGPCDLASCPCQGDKQLGFTGSQRVLF